MVSEKAERDTENPEIRDMFKALGIIESFSTGIGEAKRALEGTEVFGNSRIIEILNCSETTATKYIKLLYEELKITLLVEGAGKGKYKFIV